MEMSHQICITFMLIIIVAASESGLAPDVHPVAEPHRGPEGCTFPAAFSGRWYQSGLHTITINRSSVNTKGKCLEAQGFFYLVFNEENSCFRCIIFHQKHPNLLQYKESFCVPERTSIRSLCSTITGDANLFTMFKLNAKAIDCPFQAPLTFTYNRGNGECRNPVSTVSSCIQPSKLLFNYQACPDIPSTESIAEVVQCQSFWKESNYRYFIGLVDYPHRHHASYEERFRCFVYMTVKKGVRLSQEYSNNARSSPLTFNSTSSGVPSGEEENNVIFRLSQSADATGCDGVTPYEGSRTLIFRRAKQIKPCYYPSWLQVTSHWYSLDQKTMYTFDSSTMKVSNRSSLPSSAESVGNEPELTRISSVCFQILENPSPDEFTLILHTTSAQQCRNGYMCTRFHRRDTHIVELQFGAIASKAEDACHISNWNPSKLPYTTLTSATSVKKKCPTLGRFGITSLAQEGRSVRDTCVNGYHSFSVGCNQKDTIEFQSVCTNTELISDFYSCHGWWEENGINYLITTSSSSRASSSLGSRKYCFVYRDMPIPFESKTYQEKLKSKSFIENNIAVYRGDEQDNFGRVMQFSSIADSCRRDVSPGIEGFLAFNVTSKGRCNDISGSSKASLVTKLWLFAINVAVAVTLQ